MPIRAHDLLTIVARFGTLLPQQIASLISRQPLQELDSHLLLYIEDQLQRLRRRGFVRALDGGDWVGVLKDERHLYRRRCSADSLSPPWLSPLFARTLATVETYAGWRGWAEEDAICAEALAGFGRRVDARKRIRVLVRKGLAEERTFPATTHMRPYALRAKATRLLAQRSEQLPGRAVPLPRVPEPHRVAHHLLCVEAALTILRLLRRPMIQFQGPEDLRTRRQIEFQGAGSREPSAPVPDAHLRYRTGDGISRSVPIMVIGAHETAAVLHQKVGSLSEQSEMIIFAVTPRVAHRVEQLTGCRAYLL